MPAPKKAMFSKLAKVNFASKNINLPVNWEKPGTQYPDAFKPGEKSVAPNPPMTLFREATLNKYHVDTANTIGKAFEDFIEGTCGAICGAIDKWMKMTSIAGVIIAGPVGALLPGCVLGPPLTPLIFASAPKSTPQEIKYSKAIANAVGMLWQPWQSGLMGTLMYPAFTACPAPMPPTPNVPMPVAMFPSAGEAGLSPMNMKGLMEANLADPEALHASDLFDAVSNAFATIFQAFKTTTMIQNVLGTGSPAVPGGPVVGGTVIPKPGVFV